LLEHSRTGAGGFRGWLASGLNAVGWCACATPNCQTNQKPANRCAAPDFSSARLVAAAQPPESTSNSSYYYTNVIYVVPPSQRDHMCSGLLAADVTWAPAQGSSTAGAAVWTGGTNGGGRVCPAAAAALPDASLGLFCAPFGNPNRGMTSFDNILWAWITIFQIITQVGFCIEGGVDGHCSVRFLQIQRLETPPLTTPRNPHIANQSNRRAGPTFFMQPRKPSHLGSGSSTCF